MEDDKKQEENRRLARALDLPEVMAGSIDFSEAARNAAKGIAAFYLELKAQFIPESIAVELTIAWMNALYGATRKDTNEQ